MTFSATMFKTIGRRRSAVAWLAAGLAMSLTGCKPPPPVEAPVRAVRTLVIGADTTGGALEFAGEVRPRIEARLGFRVSGKVVRRNVELGQSVKAGQVLAQLDPKDLRLGQDSARAAVASAQTSLDLASADLKRYRDLKEQGFISAAELDRRSATVQSAQSTLAQATSQLATQGNQADYALLVADAAGVVTGIDVEPGTVVAAGTPAIRVALDGPRDVVFSVPEDRLATMRAMTGVAGALKVRPWSDTRELLPARVREISAAADPATRTFLVKADVGAAPLAIGQTATVLLALAPVQTLTRLPLAAITQVQGRTSVWLLDPRAMTVARKAIDVGGASGDTVVVAQGLAPGDEVVTAGVHVLNEGEIVKRYVEPYAASPPPSSTQLTPSRGAVPAASEQAGRAASASRGNGHGR